MTKTQMPDRKAATKDKKPEKKGAKPPAKATAKVEAKKSQDLKSILRAMVKPLPPAKQKPPKVTASAIANGATKSSSSHPSGQTMTKTTTTAVKAAQRPGVQSGKPAAKGQKGEGEGQTEERGEVLRRCIRCLGRLRRLERERGR